MWFKVDDQLAFHRKTIRAGNAAVGLWTRAGSWLASQGGGDTPGILLDAEAETMGTRTERRKLVDAGFWHVPGHTCKRCPQPPAGAYVFHDWAGYQPTTEEIEAKRSEWAARKRRSRLHKNGDHTECLPDRCSHVPTDTAQSR